jgi:hypothetical protein
MEREKEIQSDTGSDSAILPASIYTRAANAACGK